MMFFNVCEKSSIFGMEYLIFMIKLKLKGEPKRYHTRVNYSHANNKICGDTRLKPLKSLIF